MEEEDIYFYAAGLVLVIIGYFIFYALYCYKSKRYELQFKRIFKIHLDSKYRKRLDNNSSVRDQCQQTMDYEKEPPPAYETIVHFEANYQDPPPYPKWHKNQWKNKSHFNFVILVILVYVVSLNKCLRNSGVDVIEAITNIKVQGIAAGSNKSLILDGKVLALGQRTDSQWQMLWIVQPK